MSAGMCAAPGLLSFRRIVDIPFERCVAALESWQRTGQDGELRIGLSLLRGPIEHDRDSDTYRIDVRLARGRLHPLLRMRLDIDRWTWPPARTALELIPCQRVRPTTTYFRAGRLLLDSLTHSLPQHVAKAHAAGFGTPRSLDPLYVLDPSPGPACRDGRSRARPADSGGLPSRPR